MLAEQILDRPCPLEDAVRVPGQHDPGRDRDLRIAKRSLDPFDEVVSDDRVGVQVNYQIRVDHGCHIVDDPGLVPQRALVADDLHRLTSSPV